MARRRLNYYFSEGFLDERPGDEYDPTPRSEHELNVVEWKRVMIDAARRRGMIVECYGHGWAHGLLKRYAAEKDITDDEAYAMLRSRCAANPEGTDGNLQYKEFCLSHPDVRRILIERICAFLGRHAAGDDDAAAEAVSELLAFIDAHADALSATLHVKFARWVVKWLPGKFGNPTDWVI